MGASCTKPHCKSLAQPVQLAQGGQPPGKPGRAEFGSPNARRKPAVHSVQPQQPKQLEGGATPRYTRNARKLLPSGIFQDASVAPTPVSLGTSNYSPQNPEVASLGAFERLSRPVQVRSPANLSDWQAGSESKDPLLTPTPKGDEQSTLKIFRDTAAAGSSTNKQSTNNIGTTTTLNKKTKEDFHPLKVIPADKLSSQVSIFVTKNENLTIGQQILEYYNSKSPRSPADAAFMPKISQTASQQSMTPSNRLSEQKSARVPESIVVIPPVSKPKKPVVRYLRRYLVKTLNAQQGQAQPDPSGDREPPKFRISRIKGDFVNGSGEARLDRDAKPKKAAASRDSRYQIRVNGQSSNPKFGVDQDTQGHKHSNLDISQPMQLASDKSVSSSHPEQEELSKKSGRLSLCDTFQNEVSFRDLKGASLRQLREQPPGQPDAYNAMSKKKRTVISNTPADANSRSEPKFRRADLNTCRLRDDSFFTDKSFVYESYSADNDPLATLHRMK